MGMGSGGRGGPGGGIPERARQRFASELGLTPAQEIQVDSIMTRGMSMRRALEDSMRPRMRTQLDSTRAQIERVLTPEQRQKFEAWRSRVHADRGGIPGPGGPGPREGGRGDPDAHGPPPGEGGP